MDTKNYIISILLIIICVIGYDNYSMKQDINIFSSSSDELLKCYDDLYTERTLLNKAADMLYEAHTRLTKHGEILWPDEFVILR